MRTKVKVRNLNPGTLLNLRMPAPTRRIAADPYGIGAIVAKMGRLLVKWWHSWDYPAVRQMVEGANKEMKEAMERKNSSDHK